MDLLPINLPNLFFALASLTCPSTHASQSLSQNCVKHGLLTMQPSYVAFKLNILFDARVSILLFIWFTNLLNCPSRKNPPLGVPIPDPWNLATILKHSNFVCTFNSSTEWLLNPVSLKKVLGAFPANAVINKTEVQMVSKASQGLKWARDEWPSASLRWPMHPQNPDGLGVTRLGAHGAYRQHLLPHVVRHQLLAELLPSVGKA